MVTKSTTAAAPIRRSSFILTLLALVFITPMVLAWYLYHHREWLGHSSNLGELITPPTPLNHYPLTTQAGAPLNQDFFARKWVLLYNSGATCQTACLHNIYNLRQIRLALGKDQDRVSRALILPPYSLQTNHPLQQALAGPYQGTTILLRTSKQSTLASVYATEALRLSPNNIYIVDPQGNVMMRYGPSARAGDVLHDIEQLLKVSQVG